mmetsp:Transcript_26222/g.62966  ORF Transcript_26222/g.62966 Transcript_26222/m.62966 type:complete len:219 (+) Transcript_26222:96-752(+)
MGRAVQSPRSQHGDGHVEYVGVCIDAGRVVRRPHDGRSGGRSTQHGRHGNRAGREGGGAGSGLPLVAAAGGPAAADTGGAQTGVPVGHGEEPARREGRRTTKGGGARRGSPPRADNAPRRVRLHAPPHGERGSRTRPRQDGRRRRAIPALRRLFGELPAGAPPGAADGAASPLALPLHASRNVVAAVPRRVRFDPTQAVRASQRFDVPAALERGKGRA